MKDKKNINTFKSIIALLIITISGLLFYSCNDDPDDLTLGEEYIESQTFLGLIDTFSVSLSTVILDTIVANGTGNILVGSFRDDIFGKIISNSYFQIGIPDSTDIDEDEVYDSLVLQIGYNKYSFGDTTKIQKVSVHQLTETIEFNINDNINSETSFSYDPTEIGSIVYAPEPNNTSDTLKIKISDNTGYDLFTKLRDDSEILTDNESFINYFHGLVLVADETYEGSIIGFNASVDDTKLVLYTHKETSIAETAKYEFKLEDDTKQFNNIIHNFTSTPLSNLVEQRNELPSSESGGSSFLQGGIGLAIRVDFPSLDEILLFERGTIAEARLYIFPLESSYDNFNLPPQLVMYISDNLNRRNSLVYNNQGNLVTSTLTIDELYDEGTNYTFDVTKYLIDELADSYVDPEKGLLIVLPSGNLQGSFYRMIADAQIQKAKLNIYYLSY